MVKQITALLILLLFGAPFSLWAAQVAAVADRTHLGAGESLRLDLRVTGSIDGDPDLKPLEPGWEILNRSQSSQMQIINGDFSRTLVLRLSLMPRRSGTLEIPAICFGADCSAPLPIEVGQETSTAPTGSDPLILEAEAQPRQALVGSQVLLTVRLLHRVDLAQATLSEPQPQGVETEIQQLGKDRSFETRRNGYLYQAIERRYALFPQRAGVLHLPKLQLDAQVADAPSGLDPFGRSFHPMRRYSDPLDIRVEPPPANPDHSPWLPARDLTLADDWQQQVPPLRVGEPATRTVVVRAPGLAAARLPELKIPVPEGWKAYPDQPARQDESDASGVIGSLQQKLALVPTRPGPVELPAVDLDWYDVTSGLWRRAHLDPLRVTVAPAAAGDATPLSPPAMTAAPVAGAGPAAAPPPPGSVSATGPAQPSAGFWPWVSLFLGLGWLLTLTLFWRQRRRRQLEATNDPPRPSASGREKDALQALWRATDCNDPKAAREALLAWSRCRWPRAGHHDLERLGNYCGEPLAGELAALGRALYAGSESPWRGTGLAEGVRSWLKQQASPSPEEALPSLYPAAGQEY